MLNRYVNIKMFNKDDILIIIASGFSILSHLSKYLFMRIFYVKIKKKHIFFNVQVIIHENMHGRILTLNEVDKEEKSHHFSFNCVQEYKKVFICHNFPDTEVVILL